MWIYFQEQNGNPPSFAISIQYTSNGKKAVKAIVPQDGKIQLKDIVFPLRLQCKSSNYETIDIRILASDLTLLGNENVYFLKVKESANTIQELIVTGQATPVLARQSIYKVNTVQANQISQRGATSLNEVMQFELNQFVSNDNLLGSSLNMGGIGSQNVKVLLNGIPVMGRENGNIDMGQMNMATVKRVEMIQGPMSVMYGSNALGGVVNIITQAPTKKWSANIRSYNETIQRHNLTTGIGLQYKKHQLQWNGARNFFQGWTPKSGIDRFQLWKPKTQYITDLQYWYEWKRIKLNYFTSFLNEKITNKGEPIINPYEGYAFDEYYRTKRWMNAFTVTANIGKGQLQVLNDYQVYKRIKNRFRKDLVSMYEIETKNVGDQDSTSFYTLHSRATYTHKLLKKADAQIGYEYTRETGESYRLLEEKQSIADMGLFGSLLWSHKQFSVQPSVRFTMNSRYGNVLTPALHCKVDLSEKIQWRASYAKGFRAPTLKEMYLQFVDQNHTIIGNPDLLPENGNHWQMALDYQKRIGEGSILFGVQSFYNSIQNLIALAVFNNHGILRKYDNVLHYKNMICNVRSKYQRKHFSMEAGAGIISVLASSVTPPHQITELNFLTQYHIQSLQTAINFNYKFNSKQPIITVDQSFLYSNPIHIANCSLQRSFFKNKCKVQLGVKNLFNIQNSTLNGTMHTAGGHTNSGNMQLFPARSVFSDITYSF